MNGQQAKGLVKTATAMLGVEGLRRFPSNCLQMFHDILNRTLTAVHHQRGIKHQFIVFISYADVRSNWRVIKLRLPTCLYEIKR